MESEDNPISADNTETGLKEGSGTQKDKDNTVESTNTCTEEKSVVPDTPRSSKKLDKINVILKPVGDAPILKQKLWAVDPDKQVSGIIQFIKKYLKITSEGGLFVFVNQAFAPSPDQLIRNLYECFGSDGKLVLHYSTTTAWG